MFDAHVVGAGPAGCVCARELARSGLKVLVSEEHTSVGLPVQCSGLISVAGLDSLGVDYSKAVLNRVRGARIYSPSMSEMVVGNGETRACVVDRRMLDEIILDAAEKEGAKIELGKRVRKAGLDGTVVVGADGAGSSVASWFGFPKISEYAVCAQADFSGVEIADPTRIEMFLSNRRFPGFFGWMIPTAKGCARVGLGAYCDFSNGGKKDVVGLFKSFIGSGKAAERLDGAKEEGRTAGIIPMRARGQTAKGNVVLVGDAAGQVKATTGGGVVFGSAAARIAAECIASGKTGDYESRWKSELGKDLALHSRVRSFLNSLSDERMESAFGLAKALGAEAFLNRFGEMDKPSRMIEGLKQGSYAPLYAVYSSFIGGSG